MSRFAWSFRRPYLPVVAGGVEEVEGDGPPLSAPGVVAPAVLALCIPPFVFGGFLVDIWLKKAVSSGGSAFWNPTSETPKSIATKSGNFTDLSPK